MSKTVLLTGASGYIAKHIALQLLNAGYVVRGTVRSLARAAEVTEAVRPHLDDASDLDKRLTFVALDLTKDAGWDEAMAGIDVLMHTASPFPLNPPKDENDLIRPAVDGALRAVRAAHKAGVTRVVMTSSTAAISGSELPPGDSSFDETNWTNPADPTISAYTKSKTLAEKAVWDFVATEAPEMQVTMINPGFVLGAPLDSNFGSSIKVIERILKAKDPMVPNVGFMTVDIRDVAEMHVTVIDQPETAGQRIMTVESFMTFAEIAQAIKTAYPDRRIVTRVAPDVVVKFLALFDGAIRQIVPSLGRVDKFDNSRAKATLGHALHQSHKAVVSSAAYLIDNRLV